ncbi:MAG TPA: hypothetical protein VFC67_13945 [Prolixibacteraceae bacterium]|nr:hypothetical protein [Prolixibacteraceae bacterium]
MKDRFTGAPDRESGLNYLCEGYKLFFNHCKPFVEQVVKTWRESNFYAESRIIECL